MARNLRSVAESIGLFTILEYLIPATRIPNREWLRRVHSRNTAKGCSCPNSTRSIATLRGLQQLEANRKETRQMPSKTRHPH